MDFDGGRTAWGKLEEVLAGELGPLRQALGRLEMGGLQRRVDRVRALLWLEVVVGAALVLLLGSYVGDRFPSLTPVVAGGSLHLVVLLMVLSAAYQLVALRRLDYAEPVVGIQRRLVAIRVARVRARRWLLLAAPLLWTPLAIVGADALFGVDLPGAFGMPWILANLGLGLAVLAGALLASRRAEGRDWWPVLSYVADDLAGRTLRDATEALGDIEGFGRDA